MEFCMNKRILSTAILLAMGFSSLSFAAQNKKAEEPLRLSDDRSELINKLTEERVLEEVTPTSPEEIRKIKRDALENKKAEEEAPYDPTPLFRTIEVKSNNSSKMRDIYLSPNYGTTLVFLDKQGNYWPIESYVLPLPEEVIAKDIINTGVMVLTPKQYSTKGNLIVMLKDSKLPLMLTLNVGTDKIDYKTELRIDDYGPNSQVMVYDSNMRPNVDVDLSSQSVFAKKDRTDILHGITPDGYKQRETNSDLIEVWTKDKVMFIKTKQQLLSPGVLSNGDQFNIMKGSDGSYLYTTPFISDILLSVNGSIVPVKAR